MDPKPEASSPHSARRMVFILRLWVHKNGQPGWVGELQDVQTGETMHVQGLEALFDLLKQKTHQILDSTRKK